MTQFLERYQEEDLDLLVICDGRQSAARVSPRNGVWGRVQPVVAWRELPRGKFVLQSTLLRWIEAEGVNPEVDDAVEPYGLMRLIARRSDGPSDQFALIGLEPLDELPAVVVAEAKELAQKFAQPVVMDTRHGPMELDRELNWFEGSMVWRGGEILTMLEVDKAEPIFATTPGLAALLEPNLGVLDRMYADPDDFHRTMTAFAAAELAELATEWQEDPDDPDITEEAFASRIGLRAVSARAPGSGGGVILEFDDGDMFYGHSVMVEMTFEGTPVEARME